MKYCGGEAALAGASDGGTRPPRLALLNLSLQPCCSSCLTALAGPACIFPPNAHCYGSIRPPPRRRPAAAAAPPPVPPGPPPFRLSADARTRRLERRLHRLAAALYPNQRHLIFEPLSFVSCAH